MADLTLPSFERVKRSFGRADEHIAATSVRRSLGVVALQAALRHKMIAVSEVYTHAYFLAADGMRKIG